jgi:gas vesicle protein
MYYEKDSGVTNFVAGMLVGAVLGAGIALLSAPDSGKATRTRIVRRVRGPHEDSHDEDEGPADRDEIVATLKRRRRKARR